MLESKQLKNIRKTIVAESKQQKKQRKTNVFESKQAKTQGRPMFLNRNKRKPEENKSI